MDLARVLTFGERRAEPRPVPPAWPRWIHVDIGEEDVDVLAALMVEVSPRDPEALATAAQELRLPVTPFRDPMAAAERWAGTPPLACLRDPVSNRPRPDGIAAVRILDLTTHWAGPLCTGLLASCGATVVKVDPSCRPDGFRANPRLYAPLNGAKQIIDLDLRGSDGRSAFERLVEQSDLVVESFSDRVMGNLGYDPSSLRRINPAVATLALRAFPAGTPEASWVAYGRGVHAASGLGVVSGVPAPAVVAYPDPLAGLAAFSVALDLLSQPAPRPSYEVSLAGVLAPLVLRSSQGPIAA